MTILALAVFSISFLLFILFNRYGMLGFLILIVGLWWFGIDSFDRLVIPRISLSLLICLFTLIVLLLASPKFVSSGVLLNKPIILLQKIYLVLFFLGLFGLLKFSTDIFYGTYYLINATLMPILILWIMWMLINNDEQLEMILKLFFFTTNIFTLILLYNFFDHSFVETSLINTTSGSRLGGSPTFPFPFKIQYDPVSLGVALSDIFPLLLSYILFKFKKHFSYAYLIALVIIIITIFFTGTRSAWIALAISSIFIIAYGKTSKGRFKLIFTFLIFAVIIYNVFSYEINTTLLGRLNSLQDIQNSDNFLQRIEMLNFGLYVTSRNPFGIGFGRLHRIIENEHNFYTFITLGTGILGLFLYLIIIFLIFNYIRKSKNENNDLRKSIALGGRGVLIAFLINGFADASIGEAFQANGIFISLGLCLVLYKFHILELQNKIT